MDAYHPHHRRYFTGRTCSFQTDKVTGHSIDLALERAAKALDEGLLMSPTEAMAAALRESDTHVTLFSIARAVAWETGGNQDEILCRLGERYPDFS